MYNFLLDLMYCNNKVILSKKRDVAQSGSVPHWGCGGRRFKSGHPDQVLTIFYLANLIYNFFCIPVNFCNHPFKRSVI